MPSPKRPLTKCLAGVTVGPSCKRRKWGFCFLLYSYIMLSFHDLPPLKSGYRPLLTTKIGIFKWMCWFFERVETYFFWSTCWASISTSPIQIGRVDAWDLEPVGRCQVDEMLHGNQTLGCWKLHLNLVGGWPTPLKNDGVRQLGWLFPVYGKIKNVPNDHLETLLSYY